MKHASIIFLLVSLSSHWAIAELVNEPIACGTDATYYPLGYVWATQPPISDNPIIIHHSDRVPSVGTGTAISTSE